MGLKGIMSGWGEDADPVESHYWVFQLLFMIGFLFHAAEEWNYPIDAVLAMAFIVTFLIAGRFKDVVFLVYVVLLAAREIQFFPNLANHSNMTLFVCLFLIPMQIRRCVKSADDRTADGVATLRWVVLVMYFFAGFHKLNEDFFDPTVSCSFDKMEDYLYFLGVNVRDLPAIVQRFVPFSVIVMELAPPVLFLFGRTQKYGILMLLAIHALLAPVGFADFSSLAMSFLWLFVPPEALRKLPERWYFVGLALVFIFMQLVFSIFRIPTRDEIFTDFEGLILIIGFTPIWFLYFRSGVPGPRMRLPKAWAHRAFLLFVIFFGMNNYLGLRTAGTLSMFSNLVTEGERSNHYLLGSNPIKVFGFQEDAVELIVVDDRVRGRYRRMLNEGNAIPRVEFAVMLDKLRNLNVPGIVLEVEYEGQYYKTFDVLNDEAFDFDVPWWQKKLMKFRAIQPERPQECAW